MKSRTSTLSVTSSSDRRAERSISGRRLPYQLTGETSATSVASERTLRREASEES